MAYICEKYKDHNSCKQCPHYRFDEEYGRMACWAAEDQKKSQATRK